MRSSFTFGLCTAVLFTLVAADGAVTGTHVPTGNVGQLGSNLAGVYGASASVAVRGEGSTGVRGDGTTHGVYGSGTTYGLYGISTTYGVYGVGNSAGVLGSGEQVGVYGSGFKGVYGSTGVAGGSVAVYGENTSDCTGPCVTSAGVWGVASGNAVGVIAEAAESAALLVWGGSDGTAGVFTGNVDIVGTLSKSAGSFKIDHPLDPENRYLSHSFVESPDMKNVYDGVVVLDHHGEAVVSMPDWFEALNGDFRYQLTCIGQHAPVYIAEEVKDNQFRIAGGYAAMKVSWQVTGIRKDPYAVTHPIPVEHAKSPQEKGRYLHPDAYGVSPELGIGAEQRAQMKRER